MNTNNIDWRERFDKIADCISTSSPENFQKVKIFIASEREEAKREVLDFAENMKLDSITPTEEWREGYNNALNSLIASVLEGPKEGV